jgi:hypothetical protein
MEKKEKKLVLPHFRSARVEKQVGNNPFRVDDGPEFVLKLWCRKMRRYQRHR